MSTNFSKKRIAVLGSGKMGGILIKALVDKHQLSPERVRATVAHEARAEELSKKLGVTVTTDNVSAVDGADIILVCVKPQVVQEVMVQISEKVTAKQLVISVAASVHTSQIESALGAGMPVIRAMPNTPCVLGQGMTALCKGQYAATEHVDAACALFNVVGRTVVVDEKHMDAVTGLSAGSEGWLATRYCDASCRANHSGRRNGCTRNGRSPCAAQRRSHHARRVHHRRNHGT